MHEAAQRRRLGLVLPLLLRRAPAAHVSISALVRLLRLCGLAPSERYLAQILAGKWDATRGRLTDKVTRRRAVVWRGVALRPAGVDRARQALVAEFERALQAAGLRAEPVAQPSWRQLSPEQVTDLTSGTKARVLVRLPDDGGDTVEQRARNFLADALAAGPYNHALEELLWRGDWGGYPRWHRQMLAWHIETGLGTWQWAREHGLARHDVLRALQLHRARAGLRPGD